MNTLQPTTQVSLQGGLDQRLASPAPASQVGPPSTAPLRSGQVARETTKAQVESPTKSAPSKADLQRITGELQRRIAAVAPDLLFSIDESTGHTVVRIIDPETKEVVQQIPSEQMLDIARSLEQFQQGLLLNRKA